MHHFYTSISSYKYRSLPITFMVLFEPRTRPGDFKISFVAQRTHGTPQDKIYSKTRICITRSLKPSPERFASFLFCYQAEEKIALHEISVPNATFSFNHFFHVTTVAQLRELMVLHRTSSKTTSELKAQEENYSKKEESVQSQRLLQESKAQRFFFFFTGFWFYHHIENLKKLNQAIIQKHNREEFYLNFKMTDFVRPPEGSVPE